MSATKFHNHTNNTNSKNSANVYTKILALIYETSTLTGIRYEYQYIDVQVTVHGDKSLQ